ncbi:MAG: hypothetical protein A4E48_01591 [Methanosaeta sp. PtaU1.Bin060]|nr:MAG: hypothetical protein A4E48_01591 [Methanosaeta sp. PtaU1.Bin060]
MHLHTPLGERPSLVAAQHIHAAEILDGRQPLDDDLMRGHLPRAVGQVDADDGRQKLWGESHGEGKGEEEGFNDGALKIDIDGEDGDDQKQCHPQKEIAKAPDTHLELGHGLPELQSLGDLPELGISASVHHHSRGSSAHHIGAHEEAVRAPGELSILRKHCGHLLCRIGLTGEGRLVHEEVPGLQEPAISRDDITGVETHDVSRNNLLDGHLLCLSVPHHSGLDLHNGQKP